MIPELGHFALLLALCISVLQGTLPLIGAQRGHADWIALARPAAAAQFMLIAGSFAALAWSFLANDFSVAYVTGHSNSLLPAIYRFCAVWGGHEGSLLLWMLMLSGWTLAVAVFSRSVDDATVARVIAVLGLVATGLLLFILFTSNPFERLVPAAQDGRDLNPMLQDPGLVIHPPMLYMGYVGFAVAFAFAIAALIAGRLDAAWARHSRPWTTAAWIFLTIGVALGSWWAYYTLGWGGWWFWDPVENASFMPWLVGTALMHSLAVTDKRGAFRSWTVLLAIAAFSLSLLGTFLVRSGVLTSVHAFATDPRRGVFILALLVIVVGSSLALFAWRAPRIHIGGRFGVVSRESMLLAGNVFLIVAAASVLLGTLYPLLVDALGLGKLSVGAPYFNAVFVPVMVPAVVLMTMTPFAHWGDANIRGIARTLRFVAATAVVLGVLLPWAMGAWTPMVAMGMTLSFALAGSMALQVAQRLRAGRPPLGWWAMQLGHAGVAAFIAGVSLVGGYRQEKDVRMEPGDTVTLGSYTFRFLGVRQVPGPNYTAMRGDFEVSEGARTLRTLHPEKRTYVSSEMPMTDAAIDAGFTRDLYVSLGEPLGGGAWAVRVYFKPFVDWIWAGCLLMAVGGVVSLTHRRYRKAQAAPAGEVLAGSAA